MARGFSDKSRKTTLLLCVFLGIFGAHRFYIGKIGTGLLMLFIGFMWIVLSITLKMFYWYLFIPLIIWVLIDLVSVILGKMKDINGNLVWKW
ncbi:MAG: TM2 domain-containing protein [Dictyoglomaceae bacterium]|nr:TM2 domain-containing protein [Dictyoglomaceae bacterium]